MKGNKFLAAALAASMVFSTVPATALSVFADSVSVEASNIQADSAVVAEATGSKTDTVTQNFIKSLLEKTGTVINGTGYTAIHDAIIAALKPSALAVASADTGVMDATTVAAMQNGVTTGEENTVVENITVDGKAVATDDATTVANTAKTLSFKITYGDGQAYNITLTAAASGNVNADEKAALDNYFANTTFTRETGVTPTSAGLAKQIKPETSKQVYAKLKTADGVDFTYKANGGQLTANADGTYSGKITVNDGASDLTYTFSNAKFTEVSATAITDAADKIKDNTYPNYVAATPANHTEAALKKKIEADLDAAAGSKLGVDLSRVLATKVAPNARNNYVGSYTIAIGGKNYTFALAKSSDAKSDEVNNALTKSGAVFATHSAAAAAEYATTHKDSTDPVALTDYTKVDYDVTATDGTPLELAIQPLGTTKAATADEAAAAVRTYLEDAVKKAGYADNGVTISVKAVNTAAGTPSNGTLTSAVTKGQDIQKADKTSQYTLLVTTSIKNDFQGWTSDGTNKDTAATTDVNYLLKVTTGALEGQATTAITLADKTVNLSNDYKTAGSADKYTYVELVPTITPADANDVITWKVTDKNGDDVTSKVVVGVAGGDISTIRKDGAKEDVKVPSGAKGIGIAVKDAGTYTVEAKAASGVSAKATLTVNSNFKDVKAGNYYATPITWGYANGIVAGYNDTTFGVGDDVTRGQYVAFLYRLAVKQDPTVAIKDADVKAVYSDVATTSPYAKAIQWAADNKIAYGTGNGKFDPDGTVTRAQAVEFIYRMKGQPDTGAQGKTTDATAQFDDVFAKDYFRASVTWGVNTQAFHGVNDSDTADYVVSGTSTTTFSPSKPATREQAITYIYRAFGGSI